MAYSHGVAWRDDMYMVWPGGHSKLYCIVQRACHDIWCGLADMAWHGKWYGLVGIAWYMYWPGEVWHSICYCMVEYGMVWPVGHDLVYLMAWRGMSLYMVWHCGHGVVYGMDW